jgi:spore coat polysaccharide biosynthesis predicted glycosyltransferase SpsG
MAKARYAITTASMGLYELSYLQIPTIAIAVSYDQNNGLEQLIEYKILTDFIKLENINSINLLSKIKNLPNSVETIISDNGTNNIEQQLRKWLQ